MKKEDRSFALVSIKSKKTDGQVGRYISKSPMAAAKKAFNKHIKKVGSSTVIIRETTAGSKHKEYKYTIKRVKLSPPLIVKLGGKDIEIKYKTIAKSSK